MLFFFSSIRRHTRCALVTGVQTCALPISPRIRGNSNAYMFIIAANTSRAERHQPDGNGYDLLILEDLRAVANAVGRTPRRGQSTAFVSSPFAIGLSFPQRCAARDQFISPAWAACLCHGAYEGARRRFARYGRPRDRQGEPPRLPRRRQIVPKHCRSDIPRRDRKSKRLT